MKGIKDSRGARKIAHPGDSTHIECGLHSSGIEWCGQLPGQKTYGHGAVVVLIPWPQEQVSFGTYLNPDNALENLLRPKTTSK